MKKTYQVSSVIILFAIFGRLNNHFELLSPSTSSAQTGDPYPGHPIFLPIIELSRPSLPATIPLSESSRVPTGITLRRQQILSSNSGWITLFGNSLFFVTTYYALFYVISSRFAARNLALVKQKISPVGRNDIEGKQLLFFSTLLFLAKQKKQPINGTEVGFDEIIADPFSGNVYVRNVQDSTITVIHDEEVIGVLELTRDTGSMALNPTNGDLYVASSRAGDIWILGFDEESVFP